MSATTPWLPPEAQLTFVVEEFRALREEVLTAIRAQIDILRFGAVVLAALLSAAGAATEHRPLLAATLFLLFAPTMGAMTLIMWANEVFRMFRAAMYVHKLESTLRIQFGGPVLGWEHKAHRPTDPDVEDTHAWTIRIGFAAVSLVSIAFGEYLLWWGHGGAGPTWLRIVLTAVAGIGVGANVWVLVKMERKRKVLCEPYKTACW